MRGGGLVRVFGLDQVGIVTVVSFGHRGACGVRLGKRRFHGRFGILRM